MSPTDDLFTLSDAFDRNRDWRDMCHFGPEAIAKQAEQVATSVISALGTATGTDI